jgi:hypothetical protein
LERVQPWIPDGGEIHRDAILVAFLEKLPSGVLEDPLSKEVLSELTAKLSR